MSGMAPALNLTVRLLTRRKHRCPAIKNPLTDFKSTFFHGFQAWFIHHERG
jgi:hypothetical protein